MRFLISMLCLFTALVTIPVADAQNVKLLTGEWAPYVSPGMDNYGFTAEVITYAFLAVGIETELEFTSWENCETMITKGQYFASFPHKRTIDRQGFAYFSDPIAWSKGIFFYMKERMKDIEFDTVKELKKYRIGGVKGHYYVPMFIRAGLDVDYSSNSESSFRKLYLDRVDIVLENEFVGWLILQRLFPDEMWRFGSSRKAFNEDTLHLMVSKKYRDSMALMKKFNQGLKIIFENGIYRNLLKKYIKHTDIKIPHSIY